MTETTVEEAINLQETARCRALVAKDIGALSELIAPCLVHVHATGVIEDRNSYLASVSDKLEFLHVERRTLSIVDHGGFAIATGQLDQIVRNRFTDQTHDMKMVTSQLWVQQDGEWRQASFHATRLP
ncbi:hypothetical protein A8G00_08760 [Sphingobium sp. SA916]|nr:hypothetical protein A8G00_08760 [Sphingobium sp. SA916]